MNIFEIKSIIEDLTSQDKNWSEIHKDIVNFFRITNLHLFENVDEEITMRVFNSKKLHRYVLEDFLSNFCENWGTDFEEDTRTDDEINFY